MIKLATSNKRRGTKTSSFGTSGRISHDSTAFYTSKLYENLPREKKVTYTENPIPPESLNKIFQKSSESMDELPDNSVHLMVTAPPNNVGKEYDENLTLENYRKFLKRVYGVRFTASLYRAGAPASTSPILAGSHTSRFTLLLSKT